MPLWDTSNTPPKYLSDKQKRNVVRTPQGWIRISKRDGAPNEPLVLVANTASLGVATVQDMWHSEASSTVGTQITTTINFNQPIQNLGGSLKINVANTISGSVKVGTAPANIVYEGNKIQFTWTPTVAGTYKVQAQTAANGSATAVSLRTTTGNGNTAVSLVIGGTASNNAGTVVIV